MSHLCYCTFTLSVKARQHFGIAELDGMIYVLGGENNETEVLLTMEVYDPHCNVWRTQPKMTTVRKVGGTFYVCCTLALKYITHHNTYLCLPVW